LAIAQPVFVFASELVFASVVKWSRLCWLVLVQIELAMQFVAKMWPGFAFV
jgi:hypothetical protein